MKLKFLNTLLSTAVITVTATLALFPAGAKAQAAGYYGVAFKTIASSGLDAATYFDVVSNEISGSDYTLQMQVTHNWSYGAKYNNFPVGVSNAGNGYWSIYNEDYDSIPVSSGYNVFAPNSNSNYFVHIANSNNISNSYSTIDDDPSGHIPITAILFVTHNWDPDLSQKYYYDVTAPLGVGQQDGTNGSWYIFTEDQSTFVDNSAYNVFQPDSTQYAFVQTATKLSGGGTSATTIDNALINGDPYAILLITQNYDPNGASVGHYNNHFVGVRYAAPHWTIFNEDGDSMATGASFNVLYAGDDTSAGAGTSAGINRIGNIGLVNLYPNPAAGYIHAAIALKQAINLQLRLVNILGQQVWSANAGNVAFYGGDIAVTGLSTGPYLFEAITDNGTETQQVIITR